jgi:hypothetical protein
VGADVARPAEEQGVAERQQSDIADQQIEGAGEKRKAQRLHQEHWIDEDRRDDERDRHQDDGDGLAVGACGHRIYGLDIGHPLHLTRPFQTALPAG